VGKGAKRRAHALISRRHRVGFASLSPPYLEAHDHARPQHQRVRDRRSPGRVERVGDIAAGVENLLQVRLDEPFVRELPLISQLDDGLEIRHRNGLAQRRGEIAVERRAGR
jgi:hypothetical protein